MSDGTPPVVRLLQADDDEDVLWATGRYLRRHGFELRTALTVAAALALAARELPQLAILDMDLRGGGDGRQLALALRALPGAERLPIVFYSSIDAPQLGAIQRVVPGAIALPKLAGPAQLHRAIVQQLAPTAASAHVQAPPTRPAGGRGRRGA